jgi:hypothetical protein
MNAKNHVVAAIFLACMVPGCTIRINDPAANPPAETPRVNNPPSHPVMLHGIRWEASVTDAIEKSANSDPGKPVVLLRLLGTLDDKL